MMLPCPITAPASKSPVRARSRCSPRCWPRPAAARAENQPRIPAHIHPPEVALSQAVLAIRPGFNQIKFVLRPNLPCFFCSFCFSQRGQTYRFGDTPTALTFQISLQTAHRLYLLPLFIAHTRIRRARMPFFLSRARCSRVKARFRRTDICALPCSSCHCITSAAINAKDQQTDDRHAENHQLEKLRAYPLSFVLSSGIIKLQFFPCPSHGCIRVEGFFFCALFHPFFRGSSAESHASGRFPPQRGSRSSRFPPELPVSENLCA